MTVDIHADQIAQPHIGADQGRKAAATGTIRHLHIVRRSGGQGRTSADDGARLIGDGALLYGAVKQGIGKAQRRVMSRHAERIVNDHQRTVQQFSCVDSQPRKVVLRKEIRHQCRRILHKSAPFSIVLSAQLSCERLYFRSLAKARKMRKMAA